ncbi:MAG: PH domain-containing protein [Candidatus Parvarchaeota archaeon]|nr:PH domain-containing protein [Candidatus Parvarchaeota archaeon]
MDKDVMLPDEKTISYRKSSVLIERSFWIGAAMLVLSIISFVVLSDVFKGFLSISDIGNRVGLSLSGYFWGYIPIVPTVLAIVGFIYILYGELKVYFREYIITSSKIVIKEGIINKRSSVLLPSKIEDVNVDLGLFERVLKLGKVIIVMQMDSRPPVIMGGVKEPYKLQADILKLIGKSTDDSMESGTRKENTDDNGNDKNS